MGSLGGGSVSQPSPDGGAGSAAEALGHRLQDGTVVAADTMVFIYHLEDHPRYAPVTQYLFEAWEQGRVHGVTSAVTLLEILVKPLRQGAQNAARDYQRLLTTYPHLALVPVDQGVAAKAAALRARHNLPAPDAIQVATALLAGASLFLTNDRSLRRVQGPLEVLVLDDLLACPDRL